MMMKCPKCKREIDNDSVFCESCGIRIKKSKKGLWIALAVVAILAVAVVGVSVYNTQQEELRIERERLEYKARKAAERQAELEAQLEAERIAKEKAEQARKRMQNKKPKPLQQEEALSADTI